LQVFANGTAEDAQSLAPYPSSFSLRTFLPENVIFGRLRENADPEPWSPFALNLSVANHDVAEDH
jgi:hypothetical protein